MGYMAEKLSAKLVQKYILTAVILFEFDIKQYQYLLPDLYLMREEFGRMRVFNFL